jgi:hypothetical protein
MGDLAKRNSKCALLFSVNFSTKNLSFKIVRVDATLMHHGFKLFYRH